MYSKCININRFILQQGLFIKDNNTLAFYNMMQGNVVVLQVKERGGRRR